MPLLSFSTEFGAVEIQLLDNDFVRLWTAHLERMISKYQYRPRHCRWPYVRSNKQGYHAMIDQLLSVIDQINHAEFLQPLPEKISSSDLSSLDMSTQEILNRLHRYCVNASNYRDRWLPDSASWPRIDYNEIPRFDYLVNLLNQTIHALEEFVETPHRLKYQNRLSFTEFIPVASRYHDVDVYHDGVDNVIPPGMDQYLSVDQYDVWIKKDILGKDFITAFADHDDPSHLDIQPPFMFSGGFYIEFVQRFAIYRAPDFREWLGEPLRDCHGNYPLGMVLRGKKHARRCQEINNITIK